MLVAVNQAWTPGASFWRTALRNPDISPLLPTWSWEFSSVHRGGLWSCFHWAVPREGTLGETTWMRLLCLLTFVFTLCDNKSLSCYWTFFFYHYRHILSHSDQQGSAKFSNSQQLLIVLYAILWFPDCAPQSCFSTQWFYPDWLVQIHSRLTHCSYWQVCTYTGRLTPLLSQQRTTEAEVNNGTSTFLTVAQFRQHGSGGCSVAIQPLDGGIGSYCGHVGW